MRACVRSLLPASSAPQARPAVGRGRRRGAREAAARRLALPGPMSGSLTRQERFPRRRGDRARQVGPGSGARVGLNCPPGGHRIHSVRIESGVCAQPWDRLPQTFPRAGDVGHLERVPQDAPPFGEPSSTALYGESRPRPPRPRLSDDPHQSVRRPFTHLRATLRSDIIRHESAVAGADGRRTWVSVGRTIRQIRESDLGGIGRPAEEVWPRFVDSFGDGGGSQERCSKTRVFQRGSLFVDLSTAFLATEARTSTRRPS